MIIHIVISKRTGNIMAVYKFLDHAYHAWNKSEYNVITMETAD